MSISLEDALAAHRAGKLEQAEKIYHPFIELFPDHAQAYYLIGAVHIARMEYILYRSYFDKAVETMTEQHSYWTALGNAQSQLIDYEKAIQSYQKALELNAQNFEAWIHLGKIGVLAGKEQEAVDALKRARELQAQHPENDLLAAMIDFSKGNREEAVNQLKESLKKQPDHFESLRYLAEWQIKEGHYEDAELTLIALIEINEWDPRVLYLKGILSHGMHDRVNAYYYLNKAIEINACYREALVALARLHDDAARYGKAHQCYRQAWYLAPGEHSIYPGFIQACIRNADWDMAQALIREWSAHDRNDQDMEKWQAVLTTVKPPRRRTL